MADNIDVTPGTGKTVAADEIAGALHQRVKITVGADGTDDGDVSSANPLPISDAGGAITVDGTVAVTDLATLATATKQDTAKAVLDTIDADTGAMVTDLAAIEVLQTTIAGDTTSIDGKITACDTDDVTITASALPTGASTSARQDTIIGHVDGIETVLGTIDADTGAMVTDLAAIEVLLGTIDADTGAIKTAVEVIDNAISGTEMQVDIVASLPAGTNAIGKLAANSGVDIGDVDVLSIAAGDNNIGNVDIVTMPAVTINNASINGAGAPTIDSFGNVTITSKTGADQEIIAAPGANKQIWVYGGAFTATVAGTVAFQDSDDAVLTGAMPVDAKSGIMIPLSGNFAMPYFKVATNKALELDIATATINGWLNYAIVSV